VTLIQGTVVFPPKYKNAIEPLNSNKSTFLEVFIGGEHDPAIRFSKFLTPDPDSGWYTVVFHPKSANPII